MSQPYDSASDAFYPGQHSTNDLTDSSDPYALPTTEQAIYPQQPAIPLEPYAPTVMAPLTPPAPPAQPQAPERTEKAAYDTYNSYNPYAASQHLDYGAVPQQPMYQYAIGQQPITTITKVGAACNYLLGWMTALIMLLFVRKNRFIHFHAIQSLLFFGGHFIIFMIICSLLGIYSTFSAMDAILVILFLVLLVIGIIAWFVGIIGSFRGKYVKLPFVGGWAERLVDRNAAGFVK